MEHLKDDLRVADIVNGRLIRKLKRIEEVVNEWERTPDNHECALQIKAILADQEPVVEEVEEISEKHIIEEDTNGQGNGDQETQEE